MVIEHLRQPFCSQGHIWAPVLGRFSQQRHKTQQNVRGKAPRPEILPHSCRGRLHSARSRTIFATISRALDAASREFEIFSPTSVSQGERTVTDTGKNFPIENDDDILKIDSPRASVSGPYVVVFKNLQERWAIVAMDWDGQPRLGIRWFWGNGGNPFSSGHGTWLVVPPSLSRNILSGLPLDHAFSGRLDDYLCGRIPGNEIQG